MAGTRSAPTVDGTPNAMRVSFKWMDYTGEKRADSVRVDLAVTPAQIEAAAVAAQAMSNATLYEVSVQNLYTSEASPGLAAEDVYEDVGSSLVVQYREPTIGISQRGYVPSLIDDVLVNGTENVDPSNALLLTYISAFSALLGGTWSTVGARFTQRRDINQQVKI